MRKPRLCITSPWVYPLFVPQKQGHFGGWEVRISLIAKELARRGVFDVCMVIGDHGQAHIEQRDGVTLYSWQNRTIWAIPQQRQPSYAHFVRWLHQRLKHPLRPALRRGKIGTYQFRPALLGIYDEVDADIYTVPGNSDFAAELIFYCKQRKKKFVFLSGSDYDFYPEYKTQPQGMDMYGMPHMLKAYTIESAHWFIVQSEHQAEMLSQGYNRSALVIKSPMDLHQKFPRNPQSRSLLWVGRSDERVKRPSFIFELARRLPEFKFVVIMNEGLPETHAQNLEEAKRLPNMTLIEWVPFTEIERYFANSYLHLNTSLFEGFPNTFLQAAKYGVPTVSLKVDPGNMLSKHGCGFSCEDDLVRMVTTVRSLMSNPTYYTQLSEASLSYMHKEHDKDIIIPQYEKAFLEVLAY